jgi:hypothetical protein
MSELFLDLPQYAKNRVTLREATWTKGAQIQQNGEVAPRAMDAGAVTLRSDDGKQVTARVPLFSMIPIILIEGESHVLSKPMKIPGFSRHPISVRGLDVRQKHETVKPMGIYQAGTLKLTSDDGSEIVGEIVPQTRKRRGHIKIGGEGYDFPQEKIDPVVGIGLAATGLIFPFFGLAVLFANSRLGFGGGSRLLFFGALVCIVMANYLATRLNFGYLYRLIACAAISIAGLVAVSLLINIP